MACRNEISSGRLAGLEEDLARHPGTSPHIYPRDLELKGCVSGVSGWERASEELISDRDPWNGSDICPQNIHTNSADDRR